MAFSGRLRAGPSPLRSAIAHRRRRHSPRRAARSSPLRHSGPVGPAPIPRSLSSTTGALAASAPRARGAAAGASPGARPAPRRFALRDPRARPAPPDPFPSTYTSDYVRACRSGRRYVRRRSAVFTSRGGRALPPGHYPTPVGGRDSLPAGGVLSQAYASVYVRARRSGHRYDRRRLAGSPQGGGARPFVAASPPRWGGRGGTWPEPWEAPCRPGADGRRRRTGSCALAVPDALAVRHSNPNCYRPRWVKQVSSDKASPPTNCVILVSRNRGSPDRFESVWMHELRAVSGILRTQCGRRGSGTRETSCNLPAAQPARPRGSTLALVAQLSPRGSTVAPAPRPPPRGPTLLPLAPQHSSPPCGSILSHLAGVGG